MSNNVTTGISYEVIIWQDSHELLYVPADLDSCGFGPQSISTSILQSPDPSLVVNLVSPLPN